MIRPDQIPRRWPFVNRNAWLSLAQVMPPAIVVGEPSLPIDRLGDSTGMLSEL